MKSIKKIISILLVLMTLVSLFAVSASATDDDIAYGAGTVTASVLNIRTGPGTSYSIAGTVSRNTRIVILERTTDSWYHINYHGLKGYVCTDYLTDVLTAENFSASGTVTGTGVRMRSGPSTSHSIQTVVPDQTVVNVIGINNGWYKIQYNGYTGYMRSDLMEITGAGLTSGSNSENYSTTSGSSVGQKAADMAMKYVGYPYVYGAESPSDGFDCSGLVYYVYGQLGYSMSRRASIQYRDDGYSVSKSDLQPGDLVFFSSDGYGVTHVGIYIGGGEFVHASTSKTGVIVSSLSSSYYTRVWWGAKRVA